MPIPASSIVLQHVKVERDQGKQGLPHSYAQRSGGCDPCLTRDFFGMYRSVVAALSWCTSLTVQAWGNPATHSTDPTCNVRGGRCSIPRQRASVADGRCHDGTARTVRWLKLRRKAGQPGSESHSTGLPIVSSGGIAASRRGGRAGTTVGGILAA